MATKKIIFKLTKGRRPKSYQIPLSKETVTRKVGGVKRDKLIQYVPGSDSIFAEDHKDDKRSDQIWFMNGQLAVDENNKVLLEILRKHKWYGLEYDISDANKIAMNELEKMDKIEKALDFVKITDEDKMRAHAFALIGGQVVSWTASQVKSALKKIAFEDPGKIIKEFPTKNHNAKFVAAHGILRDTIMINASHTAVTWPDGKTIVSVAAGQDPLDKIAEFLTENTESSKLTLQAIGEGIKRSYEFNTDYTADKEVAELLGADAPKKVEKDVDLSDEELELEDARNDYEEAVGKEVPNNKKNDLKWLQNKALEALDKE